MIARVLCIAAVIVALCDAGRAQGASLQPGSRDLQPGCRSRLSSLAACSSPTAWSDADARSCCDAIVAFHTFGCFWCATAIASFPLLKPNIKVMCTRVLSCHSPSCCWTLVLIPTRVQADSPCNPDRCLPLFSESYDKAGEEVALEATALLDRLKQSLYARCPDLSGQLPPSRPCPARGGWADASSAATSTVALPATEGGAAPSAAVLAGQPTHAGTGCGPQNLPDSWPSSCWKT